ncbi:hypothetical protein BDF20DRAFT_846541 [Mycotypha africana]|uniref:uncharacterized protein n=1 Tax=Mycotypha africana TaxID=64632 RepID=UPI002301A239|nr:uncharacterized protein BDF20DRAFT_846541 [Mycotypha africana]KAI8991800.1 hypothetical protein BDF20DRAFT_846541 [Mycotypha africana]
MTNQRKDTAYITDKPYNKSEAQHKQAITFILNDESTASYSLSSQHDSDSLKANGTTPAIRPSVRKKELGYDSSELLKKKVHTKVLNMQSHNSEIEDTEDSSCSESENDELSSIQSIPLCCQAAQNELKEYKKRINILMALVSRQTAEIRSLRSIIHTHNKLTTQQTETDKSSMLHDCYHARKRNKNF